MSAEVMAEPAAAAGYLLRMVRRRAVPPDAERRRGPVQATVHVGLSPAWVELSTQLGHQTVDADTADAEERLELVHQVLVTIDSSGYVPVLVFDDTDRWLRTVGIADADRVVDGFFGRTLRWLGGLDCGLVVAVHDTYVTEKRPRHVLLDALDTPIDLPALPSPDTLARILGHRVDIAIQESRFVDAALADVVSNDAVDDLFAYYEGHRQLRRTIDVAHVALAEACDAEATRITPPLIDAAIAAF